MINGVWCFAPPFIALVYGMFEIVLRRCEEIIWVMKDTSSFCCDLEVCGDAATIIHVVILSDNRLVLNWIACRKLTVKFRKTNSATVSSESLAILTFFMFDN